MLILIVEINARIDDRLQAFNVHGTLSIVRYLNYSALVPFQGST
jgi:hypothetical protein